jgi:hypothetical protein
MAAMADDPGRRRTRRLRAKQREREGVEGAPGHGEAGGALGLAGGGRGRPESEKKHEVRREESATLRSIYRVLTRFLAGG